MYIYLMSLQENQGFAFPFWVSVEDWRRGRDTRKEKKFSSLKQQKFTDLEKS
jgi:hypothetical protein